MADIQLRWNPATMDCDIVYEAPDLATDGGLESAVLISLFTDRRAEDDELRKYGYARNRGYFGDELSDIPGDRIGSKLWLLDRAVVNQETVLAAKEYAQEALAWLVEDGIAKAVEVRSERVGLHQLRLTVTVSRPQDPPDEPAKYDYVWGDIGQ